MKYYKFLIISILFTVSEVILFIFLDIKNITNYIPLSNKYDWLSYLGTMTIGILTIIGVTLTLKQAHDIEKKQGKAIF